MKTPFGLKWFRSVWMSAKDQYDSHGKKFDPDEH